MNLPTVTFEARSLLDGTHRFVCCALYIDPQQWWVDMKMVGIGATEADARKDVLLQLVEEGVVAPIELDERHDARERRVLLRAAKRHCLRRGFPIEEVDQMMSLAVEVAAEGNGDNR